MPSDSKPPTLEPGSLVKTPSGAIAVVIETYRAGDHSETVVEWPSRERAAFQSHKLTPA
jgi:hypothetical protein